MHNTDGAEHTTDEATRAPCAARNDDTRLIESCHTYK